jgi:excisionase family DNA binding protein
LATVDGAATYMNVTARFVRRLIHKRRITVVRLGRHVRLGQADVDAFVAAGRSPALGDDRDLLAKRVLGHH